jgi:2-hydroxycyclohexanecarboxyl-CoA dehydrogenase
MRGLAGRNAIVTGGGGGIGRAICRRLAAEGCTIGVFDISDENAAGTLLAIEEERGQGRHYGVDITDLAAVRAAVDAFEGHVGPTDILVNNAGWDKIGNFLETDPELWHRIVDINLWGPLHMHYCVAGGMAERGAGRIVNIASDAGRVGSSGEGVYSACKGGIIAFSKTLARELAPKRINVNVICPGPTETDLFHSFISEGEHGPKIHDALIRAIPFKRLGQPEDLAGMVAFLASDDAAFITGQVISVSGGLTMHG